MAYRMMWQMTFAESKPLFEFLFALKNSASVFDSRVGSMSFCESR